jgi:hypothetical protein
MLLVPVTPAVGARPFRALKAQSTSFHIAVRSEALTANWRIRPPSPWAATVPPLPKKKVCRSVRLMGASKTPEGRVQEAEALLRFVDVRRTSSR